MLFSPVCIRLWHNEGTMTLFDAIQHNDITAVKQALERGEGVNTRNDEGYTPLMAAVVRPDYNPELLQLLLDEHADISATEPEYRENVLSLAIKNGPLETVEFLINAGADVGYVRGAGYDALTDAMHSRTSLEGVPPMRLIELLLAHGVPLNGESEFGESALSVASREGRFDVVQRLLDAGSEGEVLGWDPLHVAIALGTVADLRRELGAGAELVAYDGWNRTPLLLAMQIGDFEKIELLHAANGNLEEVGHCGMRPLMYAVESGNAEVLNWLIERGVDLDAQNEFGETALMQAVQLNQVECVRALLEAGADLHKTDYLPTRPFDTRVMLEEIDPGFAAMSEEEKDDFAAGLDEMPGKRAIEMAEHPEVVRLLVKAGASLEEISNEARAAWLGFESRGEIIATAQEYQAAKYPRAGKENPEKVEEPFWNAMVRSGASAFDARSKFNEEEHEGGAVWCYTRYGKSITTLPNGRIVEIGGEHEDFYDRDFYIYNDVFVHHGDSNFDIYCYPAEVFPPTDFHSATLVDNDIYIIGCLGHPQDRQSDYTPVYRLNCETFAIEEVVTTGESPGWIHRHTAQFHPEAGEAGEIHLWGGGIFVVDDGEGYEDEEEAENEETGDDEYDDESTEGEGEIEAYWMDNEWLFVLDLHTMEWRAQELELEEE